jgi:DNA-binding HxlR family transcriptional regulator
MKNLTTEHDPSVCPIQKLTEILSDGWTILIIRDLIKSPMRFCQLEKSLVGISTRTLTLKLGKLIEESVIVHVETLYSITQKGKALAPIIKEMEKVGKSL